MHVFARQGVKIRPLSIVSSSGQTRRYSDPLSESDQMSHGSLVSMLYFSKSKEVIEMEVSEMEIALGE